MSTLAELARTYYDTVDTVPADVPPLFASDAVYKRPGYPAFEGAEALVAFYTGERVIASGKHGITHLIPDEASRTVFVEGGVHRAAEGRHRGARALRGRPGVRRRRADPAPPDLLRRHPGLRRGLAPSEPPRPSPP